MKTPILSTNCIQRSPWRSALLFISLLIACFGLSPKIQAVVPAPDGGYPRGNTAEGENALFSLTTGTTNTAVGFQALFNNTIGNYNTANGGFALFNNSSGYGNTATGRSALQSNTTGNYNTANGGFALFNNATGSFNTANGYEALASNATGIGNTANGVFALDANTTGNYNTANGDFALFNNATGNGNTANGHQALASNTTGIRNTANGTQALLHNQIGNGNIADGYQALINNTGSFNIAIGYTAGVNLTTGRDNIDIGATGAAGESNTIRIGNPKQTATFIKGIRGVNTRMADALPVLIDSAGQLGTLSSSRRYKGDIETMNEASEAILSLKPVTFHYKSDKTRTPQFGLIAEEVARVNPALVVRDEKGEVYTVRYDAVNAMLLNEFLKEHRKVQELEATVQKQQRDFQATATQQQKQIEALTAGLQKVNLRLEVSKAAPQTVQNNQ